MHAVDEHDDWLDTCVSTRLAVFMLKYAMENYNRVIDGAWHCGTNTCIMQSCSSTACMIYK